MKSILIFILCMWQLNSLYAQSESHLFFERGIKANDNFLQFLRSHPCEIGLDEKCARPFSARDLMTLKNILNDLDEWRKVSFDGIVPMASLVIDTPSEVSLSSKFSVEASDKFSKVNLNLNDFDSQNFVEKARTSTATMMLLYDSFFRMGDILGKAKKLRQVLENDLPKEGSVLRYTFELVMNESLWKRTTYAVQFLEKVKKAGFSLSNSREKIFLQYMESSFIYHKMIADDLDFRIRKAFSLAAQLGESQFFRKVYVLMGLVSKIFGNTVGLFQSRDGKLKKLAETPDEMKRIKEKLKPLDILLEKTPMRLTDHFIPGYFGHVAIWVGTEMEISNFRVLHNGKEIPLLSHPDVLPHLTKIKEGRLVLEALRIPGVTLNTIENFMDIDDLVVLRNPSLGESDKAEFLLRAFQQIGKPYDFNFNVESESEIVCSELIYAVFIDEDWPVSRSAGRFTISPDHVAWKAVDTCYEPVLMFLHGKEVASRMKSELKTVLSGEGGIEYRSTGRCEGVNRSSYSNHPPQK
jgi:Permuted papain-like amidase enzyme, YaeF/YiiX, C92 family